MQFSYSNLLQLEGQVRGTMAGFMTPQFVVGFPGGGWKRLAALSESYDEETGVSKHKTKEWRSRANF